MGSDDLELVDISLTSLARHINEGLTVTLGGNAQKRDTLATINENRVVNPRDLENQPCHENYVHISGGESNCNPKFNIPQPMDKHDALDQLKWSIGGIQEPIMGTDTCHSSNEMSAAASWPTLSDYSDIDFGSTTTWPPSSTMGSSSEDALLTEPRSPLTSGSEAFESHSMRSRPYSRHRTIGTWAAHEEIFNSHKDNVLRHENESNCFEGGDMTSNVSISSVIAADLITPFMSECGRVAPGIPKVGTPTQLSGCPVLHEVNIQQEQDMDLFFEGYSQTTGRLIENSELITNTQERTVTLSNACTKCPFSASTLGRLKSVDRVVHLDTTC